MPEDRGFFKGASDALSLAVPLVMQKRKMDVAKQQFDTQMFMKGLELTQKADQAKETIIANMYKSGFEKAIETGDENLARNILTSMQSRGYNMGGFQIPEQLEGKIPTTLESAYTKSMIGGDPNEAIFNKMLALKKATKTDESKKTLASLKSDYMQQIGRYYNAKRSVGQFIPDENKEAVAAEAFNSAAIIAKRYIEAGGKWEDLGLKKSNESSKIDDRRSEAENFLKANKMPLTEANIKHYLDNY